MVFISRIEWSKKCKTTVWYINIICIQIRDIWAGSTICKVFPCKREGRVSEGEGDRDGDGDENCDEMEIYDGDAHRQNADKEGDD